MRLTSSRLKGDKEIMFAWVLFTRLSDVTWGWKL